MALRNLFVVGLLAGTLLVGFAPSALATPPGCDPDYPCDPPPYDPLGPFHDTIELAICKVRYHVLHQPCT